MMPDDAKPVVFFRTDLVSLALITGAATGKFDNTVSFRTMVWAYKKATKAINATRASQGWAAEPITMVITR